MENRIDRLFDKRDKKVLSLFFTAGYLGLDSTMPILEQIEKSGVDLVEIGMPFSDPVADGPTIQRSSEVALDNGMSLKQLFKELKNLREKITIPIVLMGYINPVMKYGVEAFCQKCKEVGIDGLILPDLPFNLASSENYSNIFRENNLHNIYLITPQTTDDRVKEIALASGGFIYMVSSNATTGSKTKSAFNEEYFQRVSALNLDIPRVVGFGIKDKSSFDQACEMSSGAIVGTAFVNFLGASEDSIARIPEFVKTIRPE